MKRDQWHPLFARLLRPVVEAHYEVQTTVPVGDLPREADIVLLSRRHEAATTFHGLWRHLTTWNVLEFKGPTVAPRRGDLRLLIELGLGINRRLQGQRRRQGQAGVPAPGVSFWYLASRLGPRFLSGAAQELGELIECAPGVWHGEVVRHPIFLVSTVNLTVEEESLPLHVIATEPLAVEREVARLVLTRPDLQALYAQWLAALHPAAWKEFPMGKTLEESIDLRPLVEYLGLERVLAQVGVDRLIEQVGLDRLIEQVGLDRLIEQVGLDRLIEQVGLDRLIEQVGVERLVDEAGVAKVVKAIGVERLVAEMTPAQRREFKRRLKSE